MYRLIGSLRPTRAQTRFALALLPCMLIVAPVAGAFTARQAHADTVAPYPSAVLADGPAGYWRLGDAAGAPIATDSSGGGRSGTYLQAGLGAAGALVGDPDTAAALAGVSGSGVSVPSTAALNFGTTGFGLDTWVKTTATSGTIAAKSPGFGHAPCGTDQSGGTWGAGWAVALSGSTVKALVADGSLLHGACFTLHVVTALGPSSVTVNDGEWHHVAVSVDRTAGTVTVSVDGQSATTTLGLTGSVSSSASMCKRLEAG